MWGNLSDVISFSKDAINSKKATQQIRVALVLSSTSNSFLAAGPAGASWFGCMLLLDWSGPNLNRG